MANPDPKADLLRLKQAMVDDILAASDDKILAHFAEDCGSPEDNAVHLQVVFEKAVLRANKARLHAAKAGVAAERAASTPAPAVSIADARVRLKKVMDAHVDDKSFTLAARKENELSDEDVLDMLDAMRDLGLLD